VADDVLSANLQGTEDKGSRFSLFPIKALLAKCAGAAQKSGSLKKN